MYLSIKTYLEDIKEVTFISSDVQSKFINLPFIKINVVPHLHNQKVEVLVLKISKSDIDMACIQEMLSTSHSFLTVHLTNKIEHLQSSFLLSTHFNAVHNHTNSFDLHFTLENIHKNDYILFQN